MAGLSLDHPGAFTFGILGNIISFMVYLSPLPTFFRVYRKKSTEGFQSIPYVVALFSATIWIYYASLKGISDNILLVTINVVGCCIEGMYVIIYLIYAPKTARAYTGKIIFILNIFIFGLVVLLSQMFSKGHNRVVVVGWICVAFSVCVFIAPLTIITLVVRTRSVEFMPPSLSVFLTLSAVLWFCYGLATKDKFVAYPNVLGFLFGVVQMALYLYYKNASQRPAVVVLEQYVPELVIAIPRPSAEVHPVDRIGDKECELATGMDKQDVVGEEEEVVIESRQCEV